MRFTMISIILAVLVVSYTGKVVAESKVVEGVYRQNLARYSETGKKLGQVENITDKEIAGTPVMDTTRRGLVKINFRGEEMWLRASALKLSVEELPECPKSAPGRSADRTVPTSSGIGASCK